MAGFILGQKMPRDEPGTFCGSEKQGNSQRLVSGSCQKDTGTNVKRLLLTEDERTWVSKRVIKTADWI